MSGALSVDVGSSAGDCRPLIKLAPSPRDVPHIVASSRSFRSQASRVTRQSSRQTNDGATVVSRQSKSSPLNQSRSRTNSSTDANNTSVNNNSKSNNISLSQRRNSGLKIDTTQQRQDPAPTFSPELMDTDNATFSSPKESSNTNATNSVVGSKFIILSPNNNNSNTATTTRITQENFSPTNNNSAAVASAAASNANANNNNNNKKNQTRNKKIIVVDPLSGQKCHLKHDDHSLTDKELHVFHKQSTNNTFDNASLSEHTLGTASALTEVTYGRFSRFRCIPTSCASVTKLAIGDLNETGVDEYYDGVGGAKGEGRDEIEETDRDGVAKKSNIKNIDGRDNNINSNNNTLSEKVLSSAMDGLEGLGGLVSPRVSAMARSFFTEEVSLREAQMEAGIEEIKYRRIPLVVFPNEIQSSGDVSSLIGMTFRQCPEDFQAHVHHVASGSRAARMGVRKGDVVSFAVALSNMSEEESKSSLMAEKLIKRLESVGMRTSYRELFDIFLSKTTNTRPIGIVFRRWRRPSTLLPSPKSFSPKNNNNKSSIYRDHCSISESFEWSTDFLQALSIKCREYEFEKKIPIEKNQALDTEDVVLSFLPRPNAANTTSSTSFFETNDLFSAFNFAEKYNCASALPISAMQSMFSPSEPNNNSSNSKTQSDKADEFLSSRTLCSLLEQAVGLIFTRRPRTDGNCNANNGTGFVMVRTGEGSWSPPCFLSTTSKEIESEESSQPVNLIVIRKKELVSRLITGDSVKFSVTKKQRANALIRDVAIVGIKRGCFHLMTEFLAAAKVNDSQNQSAYATSLQKITARDILAGEISPPEQSIDFYGALQSLECPYSMHAHPVIPDTIQPYCNTDWVEFSPGGFGTVSAAHGGMRTLLKLVAKGGMIEEKREIDVFTRKFKYYLMDGVPVQFVLPSNPGCKEEKVLRLTIKNSASLSESSLEISRKRRPGIVNVGMQGNYTATLDNITRFSRSAPATLKLDDEEKRRFFSFETDLSGGPIMMLAKNRKDAMLLLCGMKLLMEREKMASF